MGKALGRLWEGFWGVAVRYGVQGSPGWGQGVETGAGGAASGPHRCHPLATSSAAVPAVAPHSASPAGPQAEPGPGAQRPLRPPPNPVSSRFLRPRSQRGREAPAGGGGGRPGAGWRCRRAGQEGRGAERSGASSPLRACCGSAGGQRAAGKAERSGCLRGSGFGLRLPSERKSKAAVSGDSVRARRPPRSCKPRSDWERAQERSRVWSRFSSFPLPARD